MNIIYLLFLKHSVIVGIHIENAILQYLYEVIFQGRNKVGFSFSLHGNTDTKSTCTGRGRLRSWEDDGGIEGAI